MSARQLARTRAMAGGAVVVAAALLAAGCGSTPARPAASAQRPAALPLATSLATGQLTWAVIPMGATAGPNLFWQLFTLPAGGSRWSLVTPPDVATNGAIALGPAGSRALVAGIHPSMLLRFSPVTSTPDGGHTWKVAGAPNPGLAAVPDSLAVAPRASRLITLDRDGSVETASAGGAAATPASWSTLISTQALAATSAGRACGLAGLTAVGFLPSGTPVLGVNCKRPGIVGIFAARGGGWRAAGPALPASLDAATTAGTAAGRGPGTAAGTGQRQVRVLRMTMTDRRLTAVLRVGQGQQASLITAWLSGGRWTLSAPLPVSAAAVAVLSSSFGADGAVAVELAGRRADYLAGPGTAWRSLPALPAGQTVTLALPGGGSIDALAETGSTMLVYQLRAGQAAGSSAGGAVAGAWVRTQTVKVPIQYGSSS